MTQPVMSAGSCSTIFIFFPFMSNVNGFIVVVVIIIIY